MSARLDGYGEIAVSLTDVPAVILAGGLGTRLQSVFADGPKVLAPVSGRPFLEYLLRALLAAGVRRVILSVGYRSEQVRMWLGDGGRLGLRAEYAQESAPLGTAGAIRNAAEFLVGEESFFVLNGDSIVEVDYRQLYRSHVLRGSLATMTVVRVEDPSRYGSVKLSADDEVLGFEEKGTNSGVSGHVNAGVYLFRHAVLDVLPTEAPSSIERQVLPQLVSRALHGYRTTGYFIDIGVPEDYHRAQVELLRQFPDS